MNLLLSDLCDFKFKERCFNLVLFSTVKDRYGDVDNLDEDDDESSDETEDEDAKVGPFFILIPSS